MYREKIEQYFADKIKQRLVVTMDFSNSNPKSCLITTSQDDSETLTAKISTHEEDQQYTGSPAEVSPQPIVKINSTVPK